jgi:putative transposase
MHKAHVIKLKPTKRQEQFFIDSCGVARFTYNWALTKRRDDFEKGITWTFNEMSRHLNQIKKSSFPWMLKVGKCAPQEAIQNLKGAYERMWKGLSGRPRFKKKGVKDSFVAINDAISFKQKDFKIWIPRLGWVKCCENLRFSGRTLRVIIKRRADTWSAYVITRVETPTLKPMGENQAIVGVDFGIKSLAVLSDGKVFENPRALKSNLKSLKRLQRSLSRKQKGSSNRKKAQTRLARKYLRISNIRKNTLHGVSAYIINNYDKIVIEDLSVKWMLKNKNIAQTASDAGFGELRRQLAYKALWQEKELVVADRYFASSKTCSSCGKKKETLKLSERVFKCECGLSIDRDLNAARNLANYCSTSKSEGREACGEGSSVLERELSLSVKQEIQIV